MSQQQQSSGDAMGLDMENRDPNDINDHIKVAFDDILAEVPGAHAIDCVWRNSYRCFEGGKSCCYKFLTAICGICIALYWGCCFACLAFEHIWCVTPSLSAFRVECGAWRKYYSICMDCFCAPCCETMGLCFSNIKVQNK